MRLARISTGWSRFEQRKVEREDTPEQVGASPKPALVDVRSPRDPSSRRPEEAALIRRQRSRCRCPRSGRSRVSRSPDTLVLAGGGQLLVEQVVIAWRGARRGRHRSRVVRSDVGSASRERANATSGFSACASCTRRRLVPCSATSTTRSVPSGMRATPCCPSAPNRTGSPCSSRMTASSRVLRRRQQLEGSVVEDVAVLVDLYQCCSAVVCCRSQNARSGACDLSRWCGRRTMLRRPARARPG